MNTTLENTDIDTFLAAVTFNADGLVPVIAQSHDRGVVLMMAWMNRQAIEATLREGWVHYWSRSRQQLWRKGETSGHVQRLIDLRIDCDGDTLLALIEQTGAACHTGAAHCFYRAWRNGQMVAVEKATM